MTATAPIASARRSSGWKPSRGCSVVQEAGGRRALVVTLPDGSAAAFLEGDTHDIANNVRASVMAMLIPHAAALATPPAAKEA